MRYAMAALLLILVTGYPKNGGAEGRSGIDLYKMCVIGATHAHDLFCLGYVGGFRDALDVRDDTTSPVICIPQSIKVGQIKDVVSGYLRRRPEIRDQDVSIVMILALRDAFPCAK